MNDKNHSNYNKNNKTQMELCEAIAAIIIENIKSKNHEKKL